MLYYEIDNNGSITKETRRYIKNGVINPIITDYEYDGYGNLTKKLWIPPTIHILQAMSTGTCSTQSVLNAGSKADDLKAVDDLPSNIQSNVKSFFKGGSNKYNDFTVEKMPNGNYMAKMTKPGDVPGSKAIYYKEISPDGTTIKVYKDTFDPAGNLVHTKPK